MESLGQTESGEIMKVQINKMDKTNDKLILSLSLVYIFTTIFMALTKHLEAVELRNSICYIGDKTTDLLAGLVLFRATKGVVHLFSVAFLAVAIIRLFNDLLFVFHIVDVNSFFIILVEFTLVFISLIIYKMYGRI